LSLIFFLGWVFWSGLAKAEELPVDCMKRMLEGQEALYHGRLDQAEELTRQGIRLQPTHPLPRLFLDSVLLARMQEPQQAKTEAKTLYRQFFREADEAIQLAYDRVSGGRATGLDRYYLGGAYGARGLGHLYLGHYLSAYRDGRRARPELEAAVAMDGTLYNAYLGLGEFEYQSAHLGKVIQLILGMPGDKKKGLAMLETCVHKGSYAALPAKIFLARIYAVDEKDARKAEPYVSELVRLYPENRRFARYARELKKLQR
jgi:tetratricopeptide (TPR) repeat protein